MDEHEDLITRSEAAELAGVGDRTIDRWRRSGLLQTYYPSASPQVRGRSSWVLVSRDELIELLRVQPAAPATAAGEGEGE